MCSEHTLSPGERRRPTRDVAPDCIRKQNFRRRDRKIYPTCLRTRAPRGGDRHRGSALEGRASPMRDFQATHERSNGRNQFKGGPEKYRGRC
ncbi:hypothetical protein EVAR_101061_1 [Eumeta japonica]|uniref:Uncharacterized protein n=1 Tax=Eumeta variegata TaxID=151549 RepID=A0A4C2A8A7_EUMVA|nr:hypothetical protein EVAR_101061_1 [Eumeta japonica]